MSFFTKGGLFDMVIMLSALAFTILAFRLSEERSKAKREEELFGGMKPIEAMNHIDEAIGRCAEMGVPAHFTAGLGLIQDTVCTANVVAGLSILSKVAESCAERDVPLIVTTSDSGRLPLEENIVREAYLLAGNPELFRIENIRYTSRDQFAYASTCASNIIREKVGANFMCGYFYDEDVYVAEVGVRQGALNIGGPKMAFVLTCDYFMIGEELMAAGAYATQDPILVGSIAAQDLVKSWLMVVILVGILAGFAGIKMLANIIKL